MKRFFAVLFVCILIFSASAQKTSYFIYPQMEFKINEAEWYSSDYLFQTIKVSGLTYFYKKNNVQEKLILSSAIAGDTNYILTESEVIPNMKDYKEMYGWRFYLVENLPYSNEISLCTFYRSFFNLDLETSDNGKLLGELNDCGKIDTYSPSVVSKTYNYYSGNVNVLRDSLIFGIEKFKPCQLNTEKTASQGTKIDYCWVGYYEHNNCVYSIQYYIDNPLGKETPKVEDLSEFLQNTKFYDSDIALAGNNYITDYLKVRYNKNLNHIDGLLSNMLKNNSYSIDKFEYNHEIIDWAIDQLGNHVWMLQLNENLYKNKELLWEKDDSLMEELSMMQKYNQGLVNEIIENDSVIKEYDDLNIKYSNRINYNNYLYKMRQDSQVVFLKNLLDTVRSFSDKFEELVLDYEGMTISDCLKKEINFEINGNLGYNYKQRRRYYGLIDYQKIEQELGNFKMSLEDFLSLEENGLESEDSVDKYSINITLGNGIFEVLNKSISREFFNDTIIVDEFYFEESEEYVGDFYSVIGRHYLDDSPFFFILLKPYQEDSKQYSDFEVIPIVSEVNSIDLSLALNNRIVFVFHDSSFTAFSLDQPKIQYTFINNVNNYCDFAVYPTSIRVNNYSCGFDGLDFYADTYYLLFNPEKQDSLVSKYLVLKEIAEEKIAHYLEYRNSRSTVSFSSIQELMIEKEKVNDMLYVHKEWIQNIDNVLKEIHLKFPFDSLYFENFNFAIDLNNDDNIEVFNMDYYNKNVKKLQMISFTKNGIKIIEEKEGKQLLTESGFLKILNESIY